jgi:hypothetical protein
MVIDTQPEQDRRPGDGGRLLREETMCPWANHSQLPMLHLRVGLCQLFTQRTNGADLPAVLTSTAAVLSGSDARRSFRARIKAQLLADMREFGWVGEAAVRHHAAELDEAGLGKE